MALRIEGLDEPIEPVPSDSPTRRRAQPAAPLAHGSAVPDATPSETPLAPAPTVSGALTSPSGTAVTSSPPSRTPSSAPGSSKSTAAAARPGAPNRTRNARGPAGRRLPARAPASAPVDATAIESSLGTDPKPINTRVASDLWDLAAQRADDLGVPLRLMITDALIQVLELDPATHTARLKATRRREQLAKIDAE